MPKDSPEKTRKSSSTKKLDPAITVALIALVGTLATALLSSPVILAWIQKTPTPLTQTQSVSSPPSTLNVSPISSSPVATTSPLKTDQNCEAQYFANIEPSKKINIEAGTDVQDYYLSTQELSSKEFVGPIGIKLTQNGKMIAALSFLFFKDSQLFKITSIVDANCRPITEYSNSRQGDDPNTIQNSNDLQIRLAEGSFVLGFQFSGTDFIRFDFRALH